MPADPPELDPASFDLTRVVADAAALRAVNPHRHDMEMVSAVVHMDPAAHVIVGYKDLSAGDFWTRGHFPGFPIFPGVLMCEAAAQLSNFYTVHHKIVPAEKLMGLGGIEESRFRGMVRPGDRLILVGKGLRCTARMTKFAVKGYVRRGDAFELVFETVVIGVPLGNRRELIGA